jgi:hypothetical protein
MTMELLEQLKQRREGRKNDAAAIYWREVRRLAAGDKAAANVAKLDEAMQALELEPDDLAAHVEQMRELQQAAPAETAKAAAVDESKQVWDDQAALDKEAQAWKDGHTRRTVELQERLNGAQAKLANANLALRRAAEVRRELQAAGMPAEALQ